MIVQRTDLQVLENYLAKLLIPSTYCSHDVLGLAKVNLLPLSITVVGGEMICLGSAEGHSHRRGNSDRLWQRISLQCLPTTVRVLETCK